MQVVSYIIYFLEKKIPTIFESGKFIKPPTCSLDSPYTEQGNPYFHTEHHLNHLTHEYIKL